MWRTGLEWPHDRDFLSRGDSLSSSLSTTNTTPRPGTVRKIPSERNRYKESLTILNWLHFFVKYNRTTVLTANYTKWLKAKFHCFILFS